MTVTQRKEDDVVLRDSHSYLVVSCMLGLVCLLVGPFPS